jgi:hypothetical protein
MYTPTTGSFGTTYHFVPETIVHHLPVAWQSTGPLIPGVNSDQIES